VLVIDPLLKRRRLVMRELFRQFRVIELKSFEQAAAVVEAHHPAAVVANLRQIGDHGLALCQALRLVLDSPDIWMMVYGAPTGGGGEKGSPERIAALYEVDAFIPRELDAREILRTVHNGLAQRRRAKRRAPDPRASALTARRKAPERSALGVEVADDPDDTREAGWGDLLRSRASAGNLRRLLTKEIGVTSEPEDTQEASWAELLTAKASLKSARRVVKKLGGGKGEADEEG